MNKLICFNLFFPVNEEDGSANHKSDAGDVEYVYADAACAGKDAAGIILDCRGYGLGVIISREERIVNSKRSNFCPGECSAYCKINRVKKDIIAVRGNGFN